MVHLFCMNPTSPYNSKNIFTLVLVFVIVFSLMYSLGRFYHKTSKIHAEIEAIREQNAEIKQKILVSERQLEYLRTPQRYDKEAKIQMGRMQEGEQFLVFVEDQIDLLPIEQEQQKLQRERNELTNVQKWGLSLFGR